MNLAALVRAVRTIAAADLARDESTRVRVWFEVRALGVPAGWLERVVGEHVARLQRRPARVAPVAALRVAA